MTLRHGIAIACRSSTGEASGPTAPILVDITVEGRPVKAVAQLTKQGFVFVLDRATGQPVWPIEEGPVPKSDVTPLAQPRVTRYNPRRQCRLPPVRGEGPSRLCRLHDGRAFTSS
jgi:glucose dehydrogenase